MCYSFFLRAQSRLAGAFSPLGNTSGPVDLYTPSASAQSRVAAGLVHSEIRVDCLAFAFISIPTHPRVAGGFSPLGNTSGPVDLYTPSASAQSRVAAGLVHSEIRVDFQAFAFIFISTQPRVAAESSPLGNTSGPVGLYTTSAAAHLPPMHCGWLGLLGTTSRPLGCCLIFP